MGLLKGMWEPIAHEWEIAWSCVSFSFLTAWPNNVRTFFPPPGWRPLAAVVSTAAHGSVQHHNRDVCRLGHLHRHSLRKPVCNPSRGFRLFTSRHPSSFLCLCCSGEPRPTQAALAVWDADGVSGQRRGGLFCWCLVSLKKLPQTRYCEQQPVKAGPVFSSFAVAFMCCRAG